MRFIVVVLALAVVVALNVMRSECYQQEAELEETSAERVENLKKLVEMIEELESISSVKSRYNEVRPKRPALYIPWKTPSKNKMLSAKTQ